jgi:hypothetical protein
MHGQVHDKRWTGRGPGAFMIGALAAATVAITSVTWPAGGSLASTTRTQAASLRGLVGIPFQRAQLSVPGNWFVESPNGFMCADGHEGLIFAGLKPRLPKDVGCHRLPARFAWIIPGSHVAPAHRKPTLVIAGFPVYRLPSARKSVLYLVPKLGVRIGAHGPKARQVLSTLRESPLGVVLAHGPAGRVPAGWGRHDFGGVKFDSPRGWQTERKNVWETCGTGVEPRSLTLINAKKPPVPIPCPAPWPIAKALAAVPGLTVVTGKFAAQSVAESFRHCLTRDGARICLSTQTGVGGFGSSVLIFSVSRPHHHAKTFILLGLSATGAQARAIFDSIRTP